MNAYILFFLYITIYYFIMGDVMIQYSNGESSAVYL